MLAFASSWTPYAASSRTSPSGVGDLAARKTRRAALGIERHRAVEQRRRVEVAEQQVGVGDRRQRRRPWRSRPGPASAPALCGPTFGRAARVEPDDAAAAGADLGEVDERHAQRVAAAARQLAGQRDPGGHLELGREVRQAALRRATPWRSCRPCRSVMTLSMPSCRASPTDAITPAAGPDSTM